MLPQAPFILLSFVNTQLRDHFPTLDALCDDHGMSPSELSAKLGAAGFHYDKSQNQFR